MKAKKATCRAVYYSYRYDVASDITACFTLVTMRKSGDNHVNQALINLLPFAVQWLNIDRAYSYERRF